MLIFEWHEAKREENLRKHGIDFADACHLFAGLTLRSEDLRRDYGERRFRTIGTIEDLIVVVVHTERQGQIRLISMRKANRHETQTFLAALPD